MTDFDEEKFVKKIIEIVDLRLDSKLKNPIKSIEKLNNYFNKISGEQEAIKQTLLSYEKEVPELKKIKGEVNKNIKSFKKSFDKNLDQKFITKDEFLKLQTQVLENEKLLNVINEKLLKLDDLKIKIGEYKNSTKNYSDILKKVYASVDKNNKNLQENIKNIRKEFDIKIDELRKFSGIIGKYEKDLNDLKNQLKSFEEYKEINDNNFSNLKLETEKNINKLGNNKLDLQTELKIGELEKNVDDLLKSKKSLSIDDIKLLITNVLENEDINEKFINQIMDRLKNKIESFFSDYKEKIELLINNIHNKDLEYNEVLKNYNILVNKLEKIDIKEINESMAKLKNKEKKYLDKIKKMNNLIEKYEEEMKKIKEEYTEKIRLYDDSRNNMNRLIKENRKYLDELKEFKDKYEENKENLTKLKNEFREELLFETNNIRNEIKKTLTKNSLFGENVLKKIYEVVDTKIRENDEKWDMNNISGKVNSLENIIDEKIANILKDKIIDVKQQILSEIKKVTITKENFVSINEGLLKLNELENKISNLNIDDILRRLEEIEEKLVPINSQIKKIVDLLTNFIKFDLKQKLTIS